MIRPVRVTDAPAIAAIYNEYVLHTTISFETEPLTEEAMRNRIAHYSVQYPYLVDEREGVIVGYCYAHPWKERAAYFRSWETTIYLHPDYTGQGIGAPLMHELIARCRAAGCHTLIACITEDNNASCEFHRRLGFTRVSHFSQVGCKLGRLLDVADYQLMLNPSEPSTCASCSLPI